MSTFSETLRKFYKRSANKVVFTNGMSLNQLAQEMWEDLGCKGVDSSVLSKVMRGQRCFTQSQVKSFCKILHISQEDEDHLLLAAASYKNSKNVVIESFISSEYFELLDLNIQTIPFLRSEGAMQRATNLAFQGEKLLMEHLKNAHSASAKRLLLASLSKVCLEQSRNISDVADYGQGYPRMLPIIQKLEFFANKIADAESYARVLQSKGDAFYNVKKYPLAAKCFREAADCTNNNYWKLEGLRAYALCLARLKDKTSFLQTVREIENLIQDGKFSDPFFLITVYEALGRCYALFSEENSFELLARATELSLVEEEKGHIVILPKIQIIRSQLTALSLLPNTENISNIQKTGKVGLVLTSSYKYTRQEKEIQKLLKNFLDK